MQTFIKLISKGKVPETLLHAHQSKHVSITLKQKITGFRSIKNGRRQHGFYPQTIS